MFGHKFDQVLVADERSPQDFIACDMCIFSDDPAVNCSAKHECVTPADGWNTFWLLGACTTYPNGRVMAKTWDIELRLEDTLTSEK